MTIDTIVIRRELKRNEFRTPIVPEDIQTLVSHNFKVFIEKSENRCYSAEEYEKNGAILIDNSYIKFLDKNNTLILGLKELDNNDEEIFSFKHAYFAHCYKDQSGSKEILEKFKKNKGKIYDLEYLVDKNLQRLVSFGYHAGFIGAILGLDQYILRNNNNQTLKDIKPIFEIKGKLLNLKKEIDKIQNKLGDVKICIIGSNGRCGKGVSTLLDTLELKYDKLSRNDKKDRLHLYDLIINCIFFDNQEQTDPFITFNDIFNFNKTTIVDISCDYSSINNPIKIYNKATTHEYPVSSFYDNKGNCLIDLIAIDNLPTLIPIESSNHFSDKIVKLLLQINDDSEGVWDRCLNFYLKHIFHI